MSKRGPACRTNSGSPNGTPGAAVALYRGEQEHSEARASLLLRTTNSRFAYPALSSAVRAKR